VEIGVVFVLDFPATQTSVAAVRGDTVRSDRILAVERFRQGAGDGFELLKLMTGEQVGVTEPASGQRALQKLNPLGLPGKLCERHAIALRINGLV
jgi:hypothetical protein